jgi:hypothetical protein
MAFIWRGATKPAAPINPKFLGEDMENVTSSG